MSQALTRALAALLTAPGIEMFAAAQLVGTLNGINASFTVVPPPTNNMMVVINGVMLTQGLQPAGQYTWVGPTVTFQPQSVPQPDMSVQVFTW